MSRDVFHVGVDHHLAPLDVREHIALDDEGAAAVSRAIAEEPWSGEFAIVFVERGLRPGWRSARAAGCNQHRRDENMNQSDRHGFVLVVVVMCSMLGRWFLS